MTLLFVIEELLIWRKYGLLRTRIAFNNLKKEILIYELFFADFHKLPQSLPSSLSFVSDQFAKMKSLSLYSVLFLTAISASSVVSREGYDGLEVPRQVGGANAPLQMLRSPIHHRVVYRESLFPYAAPNINSYSSSTWSEHNFKLSI